MLRTLAQTLLTALVLFAVDHEITVPKGLDPELQVPDDNPLTTEKIELGRRLFSDPILSADGTVSCATCHDPEYGFAQPQSLPEGVEGRVGRRNAPSLLNRVYGSVQFWDGRAVTLEEQALMPIENPLEFGADLDDVVATLAGDVEYARAFDAAFDDGVTATNLARAIASFERTLLDGNSPVDRFVASEYGALPADARKGKWIFESRGQCWRCHSGPNFTDEDFHNTGVSWGVEPLDLGRYEVTEVDDDRGRFKTPSLRGVGRTAPYMHDGSIATLREAVEFYRLEGPQNPSLDALLHPLELSDEDVDHLVAFLEALTSTDDD